VRKEAEFWITETNSEIFKSKYLIMATGAYNKPRPIRFTGMETFEGKILHSCEYKSGKEFKGQKVLVVGFGNSACEIAIDLYEEGSVPSMSVRSPVNVIPREILGLPVQEISILMMGLPPYMADIISRPLINWYIGDLAMLGLKKMPYGPIEEISRDGNTPVLDIGTIQHIRLGHIKIYDDIDHIEGSIIHFRDGKKENFKTIVACIGYYRDYAEIVEVEKDRFEDLRLKISKQKYFGKDGLYFCGYWVSPTGQIREIAMDAKRIAKDIAKKERGLY
jgi:indole-3-pyruvate monooxygenase